LTDDIFQVLISIWSLVNAGFSGYGAG